jgi:hypothetical protein
MGASGNVTRDLSDRTLGKVLNGVTSPPYSLEEDLWGGQHERRDLPGKLVMTTNTYALKDRVMVTSGTKGPENL